MKKYAIVTGATGGIGEVIVKNIAESGYTPIITTFSKEKKAFDIAMKTQGEFFKVDFRDDQNTDEVSKLISNSFDNIEILVNCAGISKVGLFTDFNSEERNDIFKINVISPMNFTKNILPSMIHKKYGKIINITSMWGESGASCEVDYSATKAAIIGFTKSLAKEVGPSGIRVNAVSPGVINTEMMSYFTDDDIRELKEETPLEKIGTPQNVADAVSFLISDKAEFITGEVLKVNGGFLI